MILHFQQYLNVWARYFLWNFKPTAIFKNTSSMHCNMSRNKNWKMHWNENLTHWGRVTHICVGKPTINGSDNGLSPERRQAIIWTNAGILLIGHLGTDLSEIEIEIQTFSLKKIRLKMSSAKCCSFRFGLNMLIGAWLRRSEVFLRRLPHSWGRLKSFYDLAKPPLSHDNNLMQIIPGRFTLRVDR